MTTAESLALLTRLYVEALGEKPPEGYIDYIDMLGYYVRYVKGGEEHWPAARVDWDVVFGLIDRMAQKYRDWSVVMEHFVSDKDWVISIMKEDVILGTSWGPQPADLLPAFAQAAGLKE